MPAGNRGFFFAGIGGDGTRAGTVRRLGLFQGTDRRDFVRAGQRIFFPWYDTHAGTELWALAP